MWRTKLIVIAPVLLLLVVRCLNMVFVHKILQSDIENQVSLNKQMVEKKHQFEFISLGYSSADGALRESRQRIAKDPDSNFVIGYFNWAAPLRFIVFKTNPKSEPLLLGGFGKVNTGLTKISYFMFDVMRLEHKGTSKYRIVQVLGSIMSLLSKSLDNRITLSGSGYFWGVEGVWGKNESLSLIYFLYFYIPVFIILLFSWLWSKFILISFIYVFEIWIFFHPSYLFKAPAGIISVFSEWTFYPSAHIVITIIFYSIFLLCILIGFQQYRLHSQRNYEKVFVIFMLLLPICLRF